MQRGAKIGHYVSEETKRKISKANTERFVGEKSKNWKGGISANWKKKINPKPDRCTICKTDPKIFKKGLHFDHDHKTGKFRAWICYHCNTALGMVKDNIWILEQMIAYLNKYGDKTTLPTLQEIQSPMAKPEILPKQKVLKRIKKKVK